MPRAWSQIVIGLAAGSDSGDLRPVSVSVAAVAGRERDRIERRPDGASFFFLLERLAIGGDAIISRERTVNKAGVSLAKARGRPSVARIFQDIILVGRGERQLVEPILRTGPGVGRILGAFHATPCAHDGLRGFFLVRRT